MAKKIGEVEVTVSPDTKGFAAQTKRELQEFAKDPRSTVKLDTEIDTEKLDAQLKAAVDKMNVRALTEPYRIKLHTELDFTAREMRKSVKEHAQKIQEMADAEQISFGGSLGDMLTDSRGKLTITPDIDQRGLNKALERALGNTTASIPIKFSRDSIKEFTKDTIKQIQTVFETVSKQEELQLKIELDKNNLDEIEKQIAELTNEAIPRIGIADELNKQFEKMNEDIEFYRQSVLDLSKAAKDMREAGTEGWSEFHFGAQRARAELKKLESQVEDLNRRREIAAFRVEFDEGVLDNLRNEWDMLTDEIDEHTAEIDVRLAEGSAAFVRGQLIDLARDRLSTIWVSLRNFAPVQRLLQQSERSAANILKSVATYTAQTLGLRLLWTTTKNILDIVPKLDRMIPGLATLVAGLGTAIPAIATGLGSLFNIGADALASFQGLLLAPAALAGMALSVGILARAFKDFKKVLPDVVDWFEELGNEASASYWVEAEKGIRSFQKAIAPLAGEYIPEIADGLGRLTQSLTDGLTRGANQHLEEFFRNTLRGLEEASQGFDQLGEAIMRMIGVGSRHFGDLGAWFTDIMTDFNDWIEKNDKNGNLNRWIEEAGRSIRDLGSVVYSVGSIFASLAKGADAAGLPDLSDFASGLRQLRDAMKGDGFQDQYVAGLKNMKAFIEEIASLAPKAEEALSNIWDLFSDSSIILAAPLTTLFGGILDGLNSEKFQGGIRNFVTSIGSFLHDITPGMERLTEEFGSMLEIVGVAAESWGPAFNEMLLLISDVGEAIHPGFAEFIEETGPNLLKLVEDLREPATKAAEAISDLLGDEEVQEAFNDFVDTLGDIVEFFLDLVPAATEAAKAVARFYNALPDDLQTGITVGAGLLGWLPGLSGLLLGALGGVKKLLGGIGLLTRGMWLLSDGLKAAWRSSKLFRAGIVLAGVAIALKVIKPLDLANLADRAVEALGLGDTWLGDFTDQVSKKIEESFGDKSLLDIITEDITGMFKDLFAGDWKGAIVHAVQAAGTPFNFVTVIGDAIIDTIFGDGAASDAWTQFNDGTFKQNIITIWFSIKASITEACEDIYNKIISFEPIGASVTIASLLWGWIKSMFGMGDSGGASGASAAAGNLSAAAGGGGDPLGIVGFWPQIEAGIRAAVDQIVALIKGLTFTPIDLWNLLKRWIFGEGGTGDGNPIAKALGVDGVGLSQLESGLGTARTKIVGFATAVGTFFGGMVTGALAKGVQLRDGIISSFQTMRDRGVAFASTLKSNAISAFESLRSGALSRARSLRDGAISAFGSLRDGALSRARSLRDGAVSAFGSMRDGAISRANSMKDGFLSAMRRLRDGAADIASSAKNRILSILGFSASSQGGRVGSTFSSGLRGGLRAATGVARGIVGTIRSILSFSAFGSGETIGSTFAAGIRNRVSSVASAAKRLVGAARSFLPRSPAEEGPFSGSGWGGWGESIADQLAEGLRRGAPSVAAEANRLMTGVNSALDSRVDGISIGDSAAGTMRRRASQLDAAQDPGATAPSVQVNVESKSDEPLMEGLRFGRDIAFSLQGSGL